MTKNEFLYQLKSRLSILPDDEIESAISYYTEYLDEAGPKNEEEAIAKLGSPAEVSGKIIGEFALKTVDSGKKSTKKGLNIIWIIILAIFASPIALPLAMAAVIVLFAVLMVIFSVVIAFGAAALGLILGGIATAIICLFLLPGNFATGIFFIGAGLISVGVGILFAMLTTFLTKVSINGIARGMARLLKRRSKV